MITRHDREVTRERLILVSFAGDLLVTVGGFLVAFWLRFQTPLMNLGAPQWDGVPAGMDLDQYVPHLVLGVALMMALLGNFRMYSPSYIHAVRRHWRIVGQTCAAWVVAYLALSLAFKVQPPISRIFCVLAGSINLLSLIAWRKMLHVWMSTPERAERVKQKVLFIGWSEESHRLVSAIENEPLHIYEIVGVIPKTGWQAGSEPPSNIPRLGDYDTIQQVLADYEVDMVLLTDMGIPKEELLRIAIACEKAMVEFKIIPNIFQILVSGLSLENMGGIPLLGVSKLPLHSTLNCHLKRFVDIVGGALGLILSAPIMAIFAAIIKFEDGGPVLYRQTRLGKNGKHFPILKLRSMRIDAERAGKVGWTVKDDPRRLRIGAFMRKWNIDELPQFWNVLRGEMSLVGPRPERPELIERFKDEILHYNARHNIKPGITGWAQVNGLRGDTDLQERVKYDLYYIERWNLLLDFQIMVMTFFRREGAC